MADTSTVPVSQSIGTIKSPGAAVYSTNGGGTPTSAAPAYNSRGIKGQRVHHCLNFFLRLLTAMATAAALTTMIKSNESAMGSRSLGGKWTDFTAFKWFVLANAIVCAYMALTALASLFGICFRGGPLSLAPLAWLTFLLDLLLASALMSAAAAATTITWIEHRGEPTAGWPSTCGTLGGYCERVVGALIASYVGWVLFILSTISAAAAIHRVRQRATY